MSSPSHSSVPDIYDENKPLSEFPITTLKSHYLRDGFAQTYGTSNPTLMPVPLWKYLIHTHQNPWSFRKELSIEMCLPVEYCYTQDPPPDPDTTTPCPNWTFDRMGQTNTELADGRIVYIAGEHEDYYDPDFCIYNDVVVIDTKVKPLTGKGITIYGYPADVFPPTDFHTSTYVREGEGKGKEWIYVIGGVGYEGSPHKSGTMVYRLDLTDFSISKVETSGGLEEGLSNHKARLVDGENGKGSVIKIRTSTFARNLKEESEEERRRWRNKDIELADDESKVSEHDGGEVEDAGHGVEKLGFDDLAQENGGEKDIEHESTEGESVEAAVEETESSRLGEATDDFVEKVYHLDLVTLKWF